MRTESWIDFLASLIVMFVTSSSGSKVYLDIIHNVCELLRSSLARHRAMSAARLRAASSWRFRPRIINVDHPHIHEADMYQDLDASTP